LSDLKESTKAILGNIECFVPLLFVEQEANVDQDESGHRIWVTEKISSLCQVQGLSNMPANSCGLVSLLCPS